MVKDLRGFQSPQLSSTSSSARRSLRTIILLSPSVLAVSLIGFTANKPIWYDEFVFFALAGVPSWPERILLLQGSLNSLNQGQTGVYPLLTSVTLDIFGAHGWALRLPSLIFGIGLLAGGALFLRSQGASLPAIGGSVLLLLGFPLVTYFFGEARNYLPLAATSVGLLAYYSFDPGRRHGSIALVGWVSAMVGAVVNPYFIVYWPLIIVVTFVRVWPLDSRLSNLRGLLRNHVNVKLVIVGLVLYWITAAVSWLGGNLSQAVDPFESLERGLLPSIAYFLLEPLALNGLAALLALPLCAGAAILVARRYGYAWIAIVWFPFLIFLVAVIAAVTVAAVSWSQDFWIQPRQWIVSICLTWLALSLFASNVLRASALFGRLPHTLVSLGLASILGLLIANPTSMLIGTQVASLNMDPPPWQSEYSQATLSARIDSKESIETKDWLRFAEANRISGDMVWEEFAEFYRGFQPDEFRLVVDPNQLYVD